MWRGRAASPEARGTRRSRVTQVARERGAPPARTLARGAAGPRPGAGARRMIGTRHVRDTRQKKTATSLVPSPKPEPLSRRLFCVAAAASADAAGLHVASR